MTAKRGKKVQEALRGDRFTKSVVRVKLSPAEMVRILREKNELTQSELAERTGLTQSTISNLENGRTRLGAERAKTLARALRVHPAPGPAPGPPLGRGQGKRRVACALVPFLPERRRFRREVNVGLNGDPTALRSHLSVTK